MMMFGSGTQSQGSIAIVSKAKVVAESGTKFLYRIARYNRFVFRVNATYIIVLYVACELIANATAGRITIIGPFMVSGAIFIFTLSFTLIDLINEGLGKIAARRVIYAAVIANALLAVYSIFVVSLPMPPADFTGTALLESYKNVFSQTPRIVVASITAFVAAGLLDVELFAGLRARLNPGWRVVISNSVGLLLDAVLFNSIAFLGVFTLGEIGSLMTGEYAMKIAVTLVSVPLIYLVRTVVTVDKSSE